MSQEPTQPQYQPPVQPPAPKKRRGKFFAIGCGSLAALVVLIAVIAIATSANSGSSTPTSNATSASQPTQAPATPTHALKWTTTHTFSGNGNMKTGVFTAPDDWKITWKGDPASFDNIQYNLIVEVDAPDGTPLDYAAINTLVKDGNTSGQTEEHQGGQVYLNITSEGSWSIQVQEMQ